MFTWKIVLQLNQNSMTALFSVHWSSTYVYMNIYAMCIHRYPTRKQFLYFALIFCSLVFAWFLQYAQSVRKCQLIYLIFILHCCFQASLQVLDESTSQLWWAGKELQRGKKLQDFIGKNEKTKLIVKIQKVKKMCTRSWRLNLQAVKTVTQQSGQLYYILWCVLLQFLFGDEFPRRLCDSLPPVIFKQ